MNKIMFAIFFVLLISSASALESLGNFKQYNQVRITQVCSDATWVNISSIALPDSTILYPGVAMINAGSGDFYFNFSNTSQLGKYDVRGISDGCEKTFATYFIINPVSGNENNTTLFIIFILISVGLLIIAFLFENHIFAVLSGFGFLSTGIYMMIYGLGNITSLYTRIISLIVIGFGMIITVTSALDLINQNSGDFSLGDEE